LALGLLMCAILLAGIAFMVTMRGILNAPVATPTFASDLPGIAVMAPARELPDFTLPATTGSDLSLSDLRGKYTLIFFGYVHCPDFCPLTLTEFKQIKAALGENAAQVNFLFISVDGQRDTPEALGRFVTRFDPEFVGMSGDDVTLARISPDFGLYYDLRTDEGTNGNYPVDHSTSSYLVDPDGRLRAVISFDAESAVVADYIHDAIMGDMA
jgi:protein SCO1/2